MKRTTGATNIQRQTKDVFRPDGNLLLVFKDTVTERRAIDPGANEVVGEVAGKGKASWA